MRVLFYSPLAALSYHFETDLELIKSHQEAGDEIYVIGCNGDLRRVGYFGCQGFLRCMMCQSKWRQGMDLLSILSPYQNKVQLSHESYFWNYNSIQELKEITFNGVDIGAAVLSTLISNIRESNPNLSNYKKEIDEMLSGMASLCHYIQKKIEEVEPDIVYFFNGRFSLYRPVLRICQQKRIKFFVHERGGKRDRYSLTENTYPHDLVYKKNEIKTTWESNNQSDEEKKQIATNWYEARRNGIGQSWYSFTEKQKAGLLPRNLNKDKRNIGIFISSEDEFSAIQGWENPYFLNQVDGIRFIISNFKYRNDFHFFVRIHPNLKGLRNTQVNELNELELNNVTIIQANDPVNTYYLLDHCEKIITFGSTIGAESVYAGKPSILIGRALYEDMDGLIKPRDKEDLLDLIDKRVSSPDKNGVLPFGFWATVYGISFKYFRPTNFSNGFFLGKKISGNKILNLVSSFFVFLFNFKLVIKGQMSWGFLWNRIKNKLQTLR